MLNSKPMFFLSVALAFALAAQTSALSSAWLSQKRGSKRVGERQVDVGW